MLATNALAAGQPSFVKRLETSRVNDMKGAILYKGDKPTTCEVALVSNLVGFVSANCLDYMDGTTSLNAQTTYQVLASSGNTTTMGKYKVDSVVPHPDYNPTTFANNIALLKFNSGATLQTKNYIAANRAEWSSEFFVRRGVVANSADAWAAPQVVTKSGDSTSGCGSASTLFSSNINDFVCTEQVEVTNNNGQSCAMPYGSVYGVHDPDLAIAGLYSHSVIVGSESLCGYKQIFNYYTILSNYLEWGGNTAQATIYLYVTDENYVNNMRSGYKMAEPSGSPSVQGKVVGGDLNSIAAAPSSSEASSSPASSAAPSSDTVASSDAAASSSAPTSAGASESASPSAADTSNASPSTAPNNSQEQQTKSKKSNTTLIIIIIAGVVLLLIGGGGWYMYRRRQRKLRERMRALNSNLINHDDDPYAGTQNIRDSTYGDTRNPRGHLNTEINQGNDGYAGTYHKDRDSYMPNGRDYDEYTMNYRMDRKN
ncbi:hypothetical protein GGI07_003146 [Coemansia sp. Benny D115]|nr:hypothetical protein GGI07_003146 [Coemansia sp. Benny D115]